jgi:hypothetical protein
METVPPGAAPARRPSRQRPAQKSMALRRHALRAGRPYAFYSRQGRPGSDRLCAGLARAIQGEPDDMNHFGNRKVFRYEIVGALVHHLDVKADVRGGRDDHHTDLLLGTRREVQHIHPVPIGQMGIRQHEVQ